MGPDALAAAQPVLAVLRRWRPVYARWAYHPCAASPGPPPPWSPSDEERLAALRALAPDVVARASDGWRGLAAALRRSGDLLVALASAEPAAGPRDHAELAARMTARAGRAEAGADTLGLLAQRLDASLVEFVARLARLATRLATGGYASPGTALEDIEAADRARAAEVHWPNLDELVARHGTALVTLRAGIDELLGLAGAAAREPWTGLPDGWCAGDTGCAPAADPWREWQSWADGPESGAALPSTEGGRAGPEVGVYLPLLPDNRR